MSPLGALGRSGCAALQNDVYFIPVLYLVIEEARERRGSRVGR